MSCCDCDWKSAWDGSPMLWRLSRSSVASFCAAVTVSGLLASITIWLMFLPRPPDRYAQAVLIGMTAMLSWLPSPLEPLDANTPTTRKDWREILIDWPIAALGSPPK